MRQTDFTFTLPKTDGSVKLIPHLHRETRLRMRLYIHSPSASS